MKVLLINPRYEPNYWSYTETNEITGASALMPNLALYTLAALCPTDADVTIVDEGVTPIDFSTECDVVGITGYITQERRILEIAKRFRELGRLVVIGGPLASLSSYRVRPFCDVLFVGEAELTWPEFLRDLEAGTVKDEYRQRESVDFSKSPAPDLSNVGASNYTMGVLQTSRGCPYACEFCDVIVYLGRKQRYKTPDQITAELDQLYDRGFRQVLLSDDNLTAHPKKATSVLAAAAAWRERQPEDVRFMTQASIDLIRPNCQELLDLCERAGLSTVFIGIESIDESALIEVRKAQNLRREMATDVARIHGANIQIFAGMIVGFDADDTSVFERNFRFAQEAGLSLVSVSMLNAPDGTPLQNRLRDEGRIVGAKTTLFLATNIEPAGMTRAELDEGTAWLLRSLYEPSNFVERFATMCRNLPPWEQRGFEALGHAGPIWRNIVASFRTLGGGYGQVPLEALTLARGRDPVHLLNALITYRHIISVLQRWKVLDPVPV